jgi:V/A-type H+-transporting ATPase subunit K
MATLEASVGAAIAFSFGSIGTAYAQSKIGPAIAGTLAEHPDLVGPAVILVALPETLVILGFVVAAMLIIM